jgi:hypothetical protein
MSSGCTWINRHNRKRPFSGKLWLPEKPALGRKVKVAEDDIAAEETEMEILEKWYFSKEGAGLGCLGKSVYSCVDVWVFLLEQGLSHDAGTIESWEASGSLWAELTKHSSRVGKRASPQFCKESSMPLSLSGDTGRIITFSFSVGIDGRRIGDLSFTGYGSGGQMVVRGAGWLCRVIGVDRFMSSMPTHIG